MLNQSIEVSYKAQIIPLEHAFWYFKFPVVNTFEYLIVELYMVSRYTYLILIVENCS